MAKDSSGTPLMRQYNEVKAEYSDAIVLFRMGDFYETFSEDAKTTAKILGIILTKRSNGAATDVPLAGFPYHALDNYLHKLVNAGHRVAICEQVEDPKLAKGIVKREVIEVVTPGTITDSQALDQKANQYLASLHFGKTNVGYAVLDQSTGEFFVGECAPDRLTESLRKFSPREVLVGESVVYSTADWYRTLKPFMTKVEDWIYSYDQGYRSLTAHFHVKSLKGFGCESLPDGITAAGTIFHHMTQTLSGAMEHVSAIHPVLENDVMGLDGFTVRNLEIFKSLATQGTHGTLIEVLDDTVTAGGGRLLKQWLNRPITDKKRLNKRLDIVGAFVEDTRIREDMRERLKNVSDIERIVGRVNNGKVTPKEINGLRLSLEQIPEIIGELKKAKDNNLNAFTKQFGDTDKVKDTIIQTLDLDAPSQIKQGNVILSGVDEELDELRKLRSGGKEWIAELQSSERERTGIPSLKIGYNRVFGYFLEITKAHGEKVPESYIRKQTLVNSERYITPELKEYEEKILSAEEKIEAIESKLFTNLCHEILSNAATLQENASVLSRLDVLTNFGQVAKANKYVRPRLDSKNVLEIKDGRHPVVEQLLPATERFIPNNLMMDTANNQIHLITGPNMAGKSTYLRQIGLIVLMAQVGCYVPVKAANIGLVDKLFTRVGASDNLAGGESTFLVEMNEAANILNNATERSLILLDEIGRGTATYDGLSLAWAITEHLHNNETVSARTLFATHYHELTDLEKSLERLENHHIAVKEFGDKIVFLR
ncbi:MAG: DNA mismatch repair protein MutS, partial [Candidatus Marinimicrobia bacterium]|nr:DNA mismatch repair protein MutS [Candidatus Neomarinimicrobiota bacterium]MBT7084373.1 DNA mismatch repair protein MutS [Candidatus Neomarinimicrobiota bacterium]MBT7974430.1 DNA mismatch repair protein MutS [Candidatus Neomarinimicrobiota bacterium]